MLNDNEQFRYDTIAKVENGLLTRKEASFNLKLNIRQIDRLRKIYRFEGEKGFIHKNRGRCNKNKKDDSLINEIENLYMSEYYDYNLEAFYEDVIFNKYDISYSVMLKRFKIDDIISPLAHKNTINEYKEKMKNEIKNNTTKNNEKVELYKTRIIEVEKAHPRKSNNLYAFGQEVQMDACNKIWFGNISSFLHLAVDKATKKVLFGWFEYEEITRGYYVLLFNIIINYGIPQKIKTDNRSSFSANNAKDLNKKVFMTQFGKVCEILNITLSTSSVPTAKANVERTNGTFKNRLISELRHENITDIDEANRYLNEVFIPKMNKKFSYAIDKKTSQMRDNTYTEDELKIIISERKEKVIDNASCISYNSKYYIPSDIETGEVVNFCKGTKCILIIDYDSNYIGEIDNKYYNLIELKNRDSIMTKEINIKSNKKEHHKYVPPLNHPWRKDMMLKH